MKYFLMALVFTGSTSFAKEATSPTMNKEGTTEVLVISKDNLKSVKKTNEVSQERKSEAKESTSKKVKKPEESPVQKTGTKQAEPQIETGKVKTEEKKGEKKVKKKVTKVFAIFEIEGLSDKIQLIKVRLFHLKTPKTVGNFISLAEGTIKTHQRNPASHILVSQRFYDNLTFHRVIPGFMIQGGRPPGKRQGPGYQFEDEPVCDLRHNKPGILSMANAGPNTNGSQFFITVAPTPRLDLMDSNCRRKSSGHTVFGEVVEGLDIVKKISKAPTNHHNKPHKDIKMKSIRIVRE